MRSLVPVQNARTSGRLHMVATYLVAHHLHDAWVNLIKLSWIHGQYLVLDRTNIRVAILNRGTLSRTIGYVGTSPVPQGTDEIHHSALGAQGRYGFFRSATARTVPDVRTRDDSCGACQVLSVNTAYNIIPTDASKDRLSHRCHLLTHRC